MVRYKSPKRPSRRLDWTEAAFALSWRLSLAMDSKVGTPLMGMIVRCGNPSMILPLSVGVLGYWLALVHLRGDCWGSRGYAKGSRSSKD